MPPSTSEALIHIMQQAGADPNMWSMIEEGIFVRPLYTAITRLSYTDVRRLIMAGAVSDSVYEWTEGYNKSAMLVACIWSNLDMVKLLHELGADINHAGKQRWDDPWSTMAGAARSNNMDIVEYLISQWADTSCALAFARTLSSTPMVGFIQSRTLKKIHQRQSARVIRRYMLEHVRARQRVNQRNMVRARVLRNTSSFQATCSGYDEGVMSHVAKQLDRLYMEQKSNRKQHGEMAPRTHQQEV